MRCRSCPRAVLVSMQLLAAHPGADAICPPCALKAGVKPHVDAAAKAEAEAFVGRSVGRTPTEDEVYQYLRARYGNK